MSVLDEVGIAEVCVMDSSKMVRDSRKIKGEEA
jgi:hypothetical protein